MQIRDRIKELRRVKASELVANPRNWRTHPESQKAALSGLLQEIGFAGAELARELPDGRLMLIDGHCRAELAGESEIPVLVLDVDEAEADKILATFDPEQLLRLPMVASSRSLNLAMLRTREWQRHWRD